MYLDPTCSTAIYQANWAVIILDHCVTRQKGGPLVTSGLQVTWKNGNATRPFVPPDSGGAVTVTMQAWRLSLKMDNE